MIQPPGVLWDFWFIGPVSPALSCSAFGSFRYSGSCLVLGAGRGCFSVAAGEEGFQFLHSSALSVGLEGLGYGHGQDVVQQESGAVEGEFSGVSGGGVALPVEAS